MGELLRYAVLDNNIQPFDNLVAMIVAGGGCTQYSQICGLNIDIVRLFFGYVTAYSHSVLFFLWLGPTLLEHNYLQQIAFNVSVLVFPYLCIGQMFGQMYKKYMSRFRLFE